MPHVTFIYPAVGRSDKDKYIRSWQMQPLVIAVLSALTPKSWDKSFFDDRLEPIDFEAPTDLVAITIETFTAKRGYQIASEYRKKRIPVVMGGYHATFNPDEVLLHADAVCVGEAEGIWTDILEDTKNGNLSGKYVCPVNNKTFISQYDRSVFKGKKYFDLELLETSRGCRFKCTFCSITAFHNGKCKYRPVQDVVKEIRGLNGKAIFIVDDNIVSDFDRAQELFMAMKHLNKKWVGQASINIASNNRVMDLMADSGCIGLLIGFESLSSNNLSSVQKLMNKRIDYEKALTEFTRRGIVIYGTFLVGLPSDSEASLKKMINFAINNKLFIAAFNHVVPFPGTPLYKELQKKDKLLYDKWWLSDLYRFGEVPFMPECASPKEVQTLCHTARKKFYSLSSIFKRAVNHNANSRTFKKAGLYLALNYLLRKEIKQKKGLPLGESFNN